jgi:hypothetical protein
MLILVYDLLMLTLRHPIVKRRRPSITFADRMRQMWLIRSTTSTATFGADVSRRSYQRASAIRTLHKVCRPWLPKLGPQAGSAADERPREGNKQ